MKLSIIKFDFMNNGIKRPIVMVYLFLYPILLFTILSYITDGLFHIQGLSKEYYAITMMIFIQFSLGTMITNMVMENTVKYSNLRLAYIVANPFEIILSKILALLILDGISIVFYIAACRWLFQVQFHFMEWELWLSYMVCGCLSITIGLLLLLLLRDESITNNIFGIVQSILCLAGGVFFPACLFEGKFIALSNLSPAKWIIQELNKALYLEMTQGLNVLLLSFFALSLIVLLVSKHLFRVEQLME